MKTSKKIAVKSLLKQLEKLNLKEVSSADLLRFVIAVREVERQMKAKTLKPRQMRNALSCTIFKDNLEGEMQKRRLPDPDFATYAHREMFAEQIRGEEKIDSETLGVLYDYFKNRESDNADFGVYAKIIMTERKAYRSFAINGGCED